MRIDRMLIVEDDDLLARALTRELGSVCPEIELAASVEQARLALSRSPSLILVDVRLPDGSGVGFVGEAAARVPKPKIIALSAQATAEEGFALAKAGACAYLAKPLSLSTVMQELERVLAAPGNVCASVADLVGTVKFEALHDEVKSVMIRQALGLTGMNITHAAELLGVSRQRLQQWLRALDIDCSDSNKNRD